MKRLLVAGVFALVSTLAFAQSLPTPNVAGLKVNGVTQTFPASGNIVGTTDTQTLTNKSINASQINSGTLPLSVLPTTLNNVISAATYGAVGNGSTNDGPAINSALTACNAFGTGTVQLPQTASGVYISNQQINTGNCILTGTGGGKVGTSTNGVILRAGGSFPSSTALVRTFDSTRGGVTNLVIDCNGVSGCMALQYASDDNPPSTHGIFEHLTLMKGSSQFMCGLPMGLTITGASVVGSTATFTVSGGTIPWPIGSVHTIGAVVGVSPSAFNFTNGLVTATSGTTFTHTYGSSPGVYSSGGLAFDANEADQATMTDLILSGDGSNTGAVGINIASSNCLQLTTISNVFNQLLWIWVDGQITNGTVRFDSFTGGSFVSSGGGYAFLIGQYWGGPYIITNSETEGTTGTGSNSVLFALSDASTSSRSGVPLISANNFFAGNFLVSAGKYLLQANTLPGTNSMNSSTYCAQANVATFTGGTAGC